MENFFINGNSIYKSEIYTLLLGNRVRAESSSCVCPLLLPLSQNNPYAKIEYLGVA